MVLRKDKFPITSVSLRVSIANLAYPEYQITHRHLFSLQAQDIDTGAFGTAGIRYSLIGSGNNKYVHCAIIK